MALFTSVQDFFVFKQPIKQVRMKSKILRSQSPSFLVPSPCRLRKAKRAVGMTMSCLKLKAESHGDTSDHFKKLENEKLNMS